ncbi:MAG TPA: UDP-galactopyranose mutase [Candidatus Limnocylindrales bacterium]|nr:UDP-galactopyranose mutase [Candidatus Limnocylindrales bacterium]
MNSRDASAPDLLCFSHLRWGFVFQRPQHLMSRWARERRVFFFEEPRIEPGGTPRVDVELSPEGVYVATPVLSQDSDTHAMLRLLVRDMMSEHGITSYVAWYYTPMAMAFTDDLAPAAVVYDCMDELANFHGAPGELRHFEQELCRRADLIFTGGMSLYETKRDLHHSVHAFPSAVDVAHFARARAHAPDPADQAEIPHPRLGFFGVIDERMDVALIDELAARRPDWHIVLVGPVVKIDPATLPVRPNLHYLGGKTYQQLPEYLRGWDVAILPFARNDATRFISPTKTPEYMAGGKPVVSTSIRDVVRPYGELGLAYIADDAETFEKAVEAALAQDAEERQRKADAFLENISWDKTWQAMHDLVESVVRDDPGSSSTEGRNGSGGSVGATPRQARKLEADARIAGGNGDANGSRRASTNGHANGNGHAAANGNGHAADGNGHAASGNGHAANGNGHAAANGNGHAAIGNGHAGANGNGPGHAAANGNGNAANGNGHAASGNGHAPPNGNRHAAPNGNGHAAADGNGHAGSNGNGHLADAGGTGWANVGWSSGLRVADTASTPRRNARAHFDYLVVGAGFAGSVVAERLACAAGKTVLICDVRPHIGGNAYDELDASGILIHKYGPHIFHTNSAEVFDYLSRFTRWRPYEHRVLASVDGKLLPIPINLDTVNRLYDWNLDSEGLQAFFQRVAEPRAHIKTSEDVIISKVGQELYEKFFKNYTRKQWGLDASQLDSTVIARIPVRTDRDDRYFTDKFQAMPADGMTAMFRNILDHPNITIEVGVDYRELMDRISFSEMVYTGPVDEFFDNCFGKLPYRALEFRHETLDSSRHQPVAVVNYPNEHEYTRVTEFKHLTGQEHRKTSIVYEFPRAEGDPYYPVPRPENAALYRRYEALAEQTPGVHFCGRLATYRYYNMDQVTAQALTLAAKMLVVERKELLARAG